MWILHDVNVQWEQIENARIVPMITSDGGLWVGITFTVCSDHISAEPQTLFLLDLIWSFDQLPVIQHFFSQYKTTLSLF